MAVKDKSVRETQRASYRDAVAKRYAFLQERGANARSLKKILFSGTSKQNSAADRKGSWQPHPK